MTMVMMMKVTHRNSEQGRHGEVVGEFGVGGDDDDVTGTAAGNTLRDDGQVTRGGGGGDDDDDYDGHAGFVSRECMERRLVSLEWVVMMMMLQGQLQGIH